MSTITVEKKMNFGAIIFSWILKWFKDAEKKEKERETTSQDVLRKDIEHYDQSENG